jgi:formate/nitrite transporter FocA (FNT family)
VGSKLLWQPDTIVQKFFQYRLRNLVRCLQLMFNAVCKIPMQFAILLLGVLMFVFYQFEHPPLFLNSVSSDYIEQHKDDSSCQYSRLDFLWCYAGPFSGGILHQKSRCNSYFLGGTDGSGIGLFSLL